MLNQNKTTKDLIRKYNRQTPFVDYLLPYIKNKEKVKVADIGSGPFSIIGSYAEGVTLEIHHFDNQDFTSFWEKQDTTPFALIEYQNMEELTCVDNSFDLVVCINALDHTKRAQEAVEEMIRVCKPGGFVYIECNLNQMDTGHKHKWNAKEDGVFTNGTYWFPLKGYGFEIKYIDLGGESRYNKIIATLRK